MANPTYKELLLDTFYPKLKDFYSNIDSVKNITATTIYNKEYYYTAYYQHTVQPGFQLDSTLPAVVPSDDVLSNFKDFLRTYHSIDLDNSEVLGRVMTHKECLLALKAALNFVSCATEFCSDYSSGKMYPCYRYLVTTPVSEIDGGADDVLVDLDDVTILNSYILNVMGDSTIVPSGKYIDFFATNPNQRTIANQQISVTTNCCCSSCSSSCSSSSSSSSCSCAFIAYFNLD